MPCVEYHLLLILICLVKSGISHKVDKKRIGFSVQQVFIVVAED